MSLAIKKIFPKFYKFSKNFTNKLPKKTILWDNQSYKVNLGIHKMLKLWRSDSLFKEANIVYDNYFGGDFIDIGAYTGFYSFLLSPKSNENDNFISCEPDHNAHHELFLNLSVLKKLFINNCYSVITKPVSNGKKVVIAHNEWGHPCFLDINEKKEIDFKKKRYYQSISVDNLVESLSLSPTLIKIDTEGAELGILEGMKNTLKKFKPKIMLEKHPTMIPKNINIEMIDKILKDYNYNSILINKNDLAIREIWE